MRELQPGRRAMVRGTVVARDLIESSLTGERCVYYRASREEWRDANIAGLGFEGSWALVQSDEAIAEFYLQDEEGDRVIVSPARCQVNQGKGIGSEPVDMGVIGQRGQELLIRAGDTVEVEGLVTPVQDMHAEDRDYRGNAQRMMLYAEEGELVLIRLVARAKKAT